MKNVLLAVLPEVKKGSEIEIDVETQGCLILSYARELARVRSIAPYLTVTKGADEGILPLRILLAKHMLERNGGRMTVDQSDSERDVLRMEFPIA